MAERVDLLQRRVDVGRDADAFVFRVDDRRRDDPPLVPQLPSRPSVSARPTTWTVPIAHDCAGSMLVWILNAPVWSGAARPSDSAGSAGARLSARCPIAVVERQRFGNGVVVRRRMRPDLLELADVLGARRAGRRQRPQASRCSRGARRGIPCRSAPAATCAGWCRSSRTRDPSALYGKCANACAPSTIGLHALGARGVADLLRTGKICPVRFVMWQKCRTFVFGPIAAEQPIGEIVHRRRRHRETRSS